MSSSSDSLHIKSHCFILDVLVLRSASVVMAFMSVVTWHAHTQTLYLKACVTDSVHVLKH